MKSMIKFKNIGFGWWRVSRRRKNGTVDALELDAGGLGAFRATVIVFKTLIDWIFI